MKNRTFYEIVKKTSTVYLVWIALLVLVGLGISLSDSNIQVHALESMWNHSDIVVKGGSLIEIKENEHKYLILQVDMNKDGYVVIPNAHHISANSDCTVNADSMFVLVDGEEVHREISNGNHIRINLSENAQKIEILSSHILVLHTYSSTYADFCKTLDDGKHLKPYVQTKIGFLVNDVICKEDLVLIFSVSSNKPACVKSDSVDKLLERGYSATSLFSLPFSNIYRLDDTSESIVRYHLYGATLENVSKIDNKIRFHIIPNTTGMISVSIPHELLSDSDISELEHETCRSRAYSFKTTSTHAMYIKNISDNAEYVDFFCK
ncbi:hypothetical protein [Nitrosopumilus piranensis]|uniref:Uncharacterized protein n=1 Tax=Nitrosopumilus piranensis TaxID=1582439 RepID=A0A0C5CAJ7_9ARCH|nr:hypothetical protein [Nitrosopumilus piranensis]AJM92197.1 exported protein of unknown function [Nitrosopumilus piranensis]